MNGMAELLHNFYIILDTSPRECFIVLYKDVGRKRYHINLIMKEVARMDKKMTSGEIAKKMGISQKAVRLYDEKGLLKPADYSEGNYRLYNQDSILVLEKIIALKQIGFSLEEIYDNLIAGNNKDIIEALNEQLVIMEKKKQELERVIGCIKGLVRKIV